jgi:acetyltransferase-like isoleucine patch superfamily enzyme
MEKMVKSCIDKLLDKILLRWLKRRVQRLLLNDVKVWGDPGRVHIASTAIVHNALFNTVSGSIRVDEFAFFGHNVSVLTGTHDVAKKDLERQNSATGEGRDVVIGRGAWIASNATILGPCTIGRNAVIGAGSVVTTNVPDNSFYAGVPAVLIKKLSL